MSGPDVPVNGAAYDAFGPAASLVRQEVLEARLNERLVVADPLGRSRGPLAVVALVVAAAGLVFAAQVVSVDHSTSGRAAVAPDGRSALAALPIGAGNALHPGQRAVLRVDGSTVGATVASVRGVLPAGDASGAPAIEVRLRLDAGSVPRVAGGDERHAPVTVTLDQLTLWETFAPSRLFRAVAGNG